MDNSLSAKTVQPPPTIPRRAESLPVRNATNPTLGDPHNAVVATPRGEGTRLSGDPAMQSYAMMLAQDIRRRLPRDVLGEDRPEDRKSQPRRPSAAATMKLRAYIETAERSEDVSRGLIGLSREV